MEYSQSFGSLSNARKMDIKGDVRIVLIHSHVLHASSSQYKSHHSVVPGPPHKSPSFHQRLSLCIGTSQIYQTRISQVDYFLLQGWGIVCERKLVFPACFAHAENGRRQQRCEILAEGLPSTLVAQSTEKDNMQLYGGFLNEGPILVPLNIRCRKII